VGRANSDVNEESAEQAWRNGVMYSIGNRVFRHLGIPTVMATMGVMQDTNMPVGLTFAGKAYEDSRLLQFTFDYENGSKKRKAPGATPSLESDLIQCSTKARTFVWKDRPAVTITSPSQTSGDNNQTMSLTGTLNVGDGQELDTLDIYFNGVPVGEVTFKNGNGRPSAREVGQLKIKGRPRLTRTWLSW